MRGDRKGEAIFKGLAGPLMDKHGRQASSGLRKALGDRSAAVMGEL